MSSLPTPPVSFTSASEAAKASRYGSEGERGRRTFSETNPVNRAENKDEGRFRRRVWRTKDGDAYAKKNAGHPAHLATHFSVISLLFLIIVISQNGFCP